MSLAGQIAIVTGGSRGIGRGIALQLGEAGSTVYITGRNAEQSFNNEIGLNGLEETAEEITKRGGKGIARFVDHTDMGGINNAYQAVAAISENIGKPFYEQDAYIWDTVNNVGLRNNYFCSVYASRIMVARNRGLIVNVSSLGGLQFMFNVAYGVGKQALDRLSADMAVELAKNNVCSVSIWPGAVRTELVEKMFRNPDGKRKAEVGSSMVIGDGETVEYSGRGVVALASDPKRMEKTGRVFITEDLGSEYGFKDIDGIVPTNFRSIRCILQHYGWNITANFVPNWLKIPGWLLWARNSRF